VTLYGSGEFQVFPHRFISGFARLALLIVHFGRKLQVNNTLHSSRRDSKEFESAARTVSERAKAREVQGVICIDCSWIHSFIHDIYFSFSFMIRIDIIDTRK
jgi:hypothetical protein